MQQTQTDSPFIHSSLAADPDLGELAELFVEEMPDRTRTLLEQAEERDWSRLARTAHQLKGAAGSYGFDQITPYAKDLELAAREGTDEQQILGALNDLIEICNRARAGTPR